MPEDIELIPLAKPSLGEEEIQAAARPIRSGWVTQGPEVAAFEREFAASVGAAHACAVSNCTTALHLALLAVGVRPGDEVITVSHSFIATASSIRYCGATPVFVDIEPGSFNLNPALLEEAISGRTRAILCVHQLGMPCDLGALLPIARARGVAVVEDAACAAGSEILRDGEWQRIGRPHGDVACFSFHPRKILTTGDGGMITTASPEFDRKFRLLRQHSMNVPDTIRHAAKQVVFESYSELGYNYRMTDVQAAIGREQLRRLPGLVKRRRHLALRYHAQLAQVEGLVPPREPDWARSNWQSYCVLLPPGADQKQIMQFLLDRGISTRRGVMCAHREPAYGASDWRCGVRGCEGARACTHLAQSEAAQDNSLILPLFHDLTEEQQDRVVGTLADALQATRCPQRG